MSFSGSDEVFRAYVASIRAVPMLPAEDERALARRYRQTGDTRLAHQLVRANLRFVVKIALEFSRYRVRLSDLVQEGNLGLLHAVRKYDPERDTRLVTYAAHWIRAYIRSHIMKTWSLVTIGRSRMERHLFYALARAQAEVARLSPEAWAALGGSEAECVGRILGVSTDTVAEMQVRLAGGDASLDAPTGDGEFTLGAALADGRDLADRELERDQLGRQLGARIDGALAGLDRRERDVIRRRYLTHETPDSLDAVARDHGISCERVRQLEVRALRKLKPQLEELATELDYGRRRAGARGAARQAA